MTSKRRGKRAGALMQIADRLYIDGLEAIGEGVGIELEDAFHSANAVLRVVVVKYIHYVGISWHKDRDKNGLDSEHPTLKISYGQHISIPLPYKFIKAWGLTKKVNEKMNSNVKFVNVPTDFSGNTKPMVEYNGRLLSLDDAKVIWTTELRKKAMDELKASRPELYARYKLASVQTYRDAQSFCTFATKQSYCEVSGGYGSNAVLTIFGGNTAVPEDTDNPTPIPNIEGGFVYWFHRSMYAGGRFTGYETVCRIAKPGNWKGDILEKQNWIEFVNQNIDKVVEQIKASDDDKKQYYDFRKIPNMSHCSTRLGLSELSYD